MHEIAEYGIAAHALYKDGAERRGRATLLSRESNAYAWLRQTIEALSEGDNPEEFLEHTKLELFQDQVFCFTPEGQADRAAARRDADRLRLCRPHQCRRHLRRRQDQRPHHAAGDPARQWRRGRDHPLRRPGAAGGLGRDRRHRQGALRHPPRHAHGDPQAIFRPRPPHPRAHLRARRQDFLARHPEAGRCTGSATRRSRTPSPRSGAANCRRSTCCAPSIPTTRTSASRVQAGDASDGWFNLRSAAGMIFRMPGKPARRDEAERGDARGDRDACRSAASATTCRCISRRTAPCPATASSASSTPGKGITIYPIQSPRAAAFDDEPERWIDVRWDLDEANKSRFPARIMRQRASTSRARSPRSRRRSRQRRQHLTTCDGAHGAGLHRDGVRPRSLGPEASEPAADAACRPVAVFPTVNTGLRVETFGNPRRQFGRDRLYELPRRAERLRLVGRRRPSGACCEGRSGRPVHRDWATTGIKRQDRCCSDAGKPPSSVGAHADLSLAAPVLLALDPLHCQARRCG